MTKMRLRVAIVAMVAGVLLLVSGCILARSASDRRDCLEFKVIGCWNIPPTPENMPKIVQGAKSLGFNAIAWTSRRDYALLVKLCHDNEIKIFKVLEPLGIKKSKRENVVLQVMEPGDEHLPGAIPIPKDYPYQWGGAPVNGNREVFQDSMACPNDPAIFSNTMAMVQAAVDFGYDGICWDVIGYRNYHSCCCSLCTAHLASWRKTNPTAPESVFFENQLVRLYNDLATAVRREHPGMSLICHIYPEFQPNPFYGRRIDVDWCGVTASWFFPPHWPLQKVKTLADNVINGGYEHSRTAGMPLVGFYAGDFRKSPERVRAELDAVKAAGARAIMMDELGDILGAPEIATVVREALCGE